ncbi:MAG: hypothetical protein JO307_16565 [Bryobacterales bacterium]|nr:hypothetical protein [Bryobacterales bacterium]
MACPISDLAGTVIFCDFPNSMFQIGRPDLEWLSVAPDAANDNVDVRVSRVVMGDGDPFDAGSKVPSHAIYHVAREPMQIEPVTEFGGQDYLPESRITGGLPAYEFARDIDL